MGSWMVWVSYMSTVKVEERSWNDDDVHRETNVPWQNQHFFELFFIIIIFFDGFDFIKPRFISLYLKLRINFYYHQKGDENK